MATMQRLRDFVDDERLLADELLRSHITATAALIACMLKNLLNDVRTRALDAVRNGTGNVELRMRVGTNESQLVIMPMDGPEPLWLTRTRDGE